MTKNKKSNLSWTLLFFAWIIATVSTLGSLFFSEVIGYIPCTLCWYQRICMYPLVLILLAGMVPFDRSVFRYAVPFIALGWFFSLYHNLIHYDIIPESARPCSQGIPCSVRYIEWFNFITIPMLSFIAFSLIGILLYMLRKEK
ncbi:disulfide oxidoreductase [Sulfurospirillum arcachonense]|uniref:disulfide oxidoreductase n=1 Tax=Sulfurospirillum arcachonense TaxID=57666 RepID=UPI000468D736|nr:disulfide oxidoreductase [Sulfurospirillum arcachonense]